MTTITTTTAKSTLVIIPGAFHHTPAPRPTDNQPRPVRTSLAATVVAHRPAHSYYGCQGHVQRTPYTGSGSGLGLVETWAFL
ncbi:hypothetical protein VMCG_10122 [Cytospora schulzeri]|uniref:Uncharacterized protein n=1 Tax=Cytospora schulzeri TaxID=448051 RepID=A0A423VGD4_9PEZI|nr:hypothetical protein VMCG_10122 [Valsa malicola]